MDCADMTVEDKVQCPVKAFECCFDGVCFPAEPKCTTSWDDYTKKLYQCGYAGYDNLLDHTVNVCVGAANEKAIDTLKPLIIWLLIIVAISLILIVLASFGFNQRIISRLPTQQKNLPS
jgi:hypothetical protein